MTYLGIDVSKLTFDCCLQVGDTAKHRKFDNDPVGHSALLLWLAECRAVDVVACMEATGSYWQALAYALHDHCRLSVENPAKIKHYARACMMRNKTDKLDAYTISQYVATMRPPVWRPPLDVVVRLRQHHQILSRLKRMRASEKVKLKETAPELCDLVLSTIAHLDSQIEDVTGRIKRLFDGQPDLQKQLDCIQSVPGIGFQTASLLFSVFAAVDFRNSRQVVAYFGLNPQLKQSGTSLNGRASISKVGKSALRSALYAPAMVAYARRLYPCLIDRMLDRGKRPQVVIVALMRRLLVYAFTVWRRREIYENSKGRLMNQAA